jgi:hypothetical protein
MSAPANPIPQGLDPLFDHLIVTRYNVPISWGRRGQLHKDEEWLAERQRLFERYCLPSVVAAQRRSPSVTWVLLCALDSPDSLRAFMANLECYPWIAPLYVEENPLMGDILGELADRRHTDRRFLLTTRLDSDDAIAPNFIGRLHHAANTCVNQEVIGEQQLPALINFPIGYQSVGGRLYASSDWGNPFLSFLEDRASAEPVIGCYPFPHRDLHKSARVVSQLLAAGPSWLQAIHGTNEATVVCGLRVPRRTGVRRFAVLRSEPRPHRHIQGIKEAVRGIAEQMAQSADYGWKRAVVRMRGSSEAR